jgi:hypothetical protein
MAFKCTITTADVNGTPIANALVRLGEAGGATAADGRCELAIANQVHIPQIFVSHANFAAERITLTGDIRSENWDNPLAVRTMHGPDVVFDVTLGRLDTCPVKLLSPEALKSVMQGKARDPHAALEWRPPRFPQTRAYIDHWNGELDCYVAAPELLPEKSVDPKAEGWNRFEYTLAKGLLMGELGRFFWLEYAARQSDPKYLVAVFSPHLPDPQPVQALDFVVFLSPTTADFTATHPYGLIYEAAPFQEYLKLGSKYLLNDFYFVPQLLARKNRAITVMPICRNGDWGPFASGEGMLRLLREIAAFLHRQCRTSVAGVRPPESSYDELAGPNMRIDVRSVFGKQFGAIPRVGKVVVSAFSTGAAPMKELMSTSAFNVKLGSVMWGVPARAAFDPQQEWRRAFRELWDLDGFHPNTGGWPKYLDLLRDWFNRDNERIYRAYHTEGRVPPDPLTHAHAVWSDLRRSGIKLDRKQEAPGRWARILQNDRWTSVRMSDSYVNYGPGSDRPVFLDAHHTTPRIGFSHAAGVTSVGK